MKFATPKDIIIFILKKDRFGIRKEFKLKAVEYKENKCIVCGYNKCITALEFHHRDPKEKDFEISNSYRYNGKIEGKIKEELDKCDLICCRCHRELHEQIDNA